MKFFWTKASALIFIIFLLAGCGGGGGGSSSGGGQSTVTINVTSPAAATATYKGSATNLDPNIDGVEQTNLYGTLLTTITLESGYHAIDTQPYAKYFMLDVNGNAAQSYTMSNSNGNNVSYNDSGSMYSSVTGTITVTSIGAAGEPIAGTFTAILDCDPMTSCTYTSISMNGSFNVTRTQ